MDEGMRRLSLLGLVGETKIGPVVARHQIVVHAATEVLLGDLAARGALVTIFREATHILDHGELATALMVQREAAALGRRRREQLLRERV